MLCQHNVLLRVLLLPGMLLPISLLRASEAGYSCHWKVLLTMSDAATTAENVWHAFSAELRAFLRSRVPSDADADDLLQDVFLRVYQKSGSLRQAERVESWVYQIARNAVADFYRRRNPRPESPVDDVAESQVEGGDNSNRMVGAWLSLMIEAMLPAHSDALRMYEIEGLPQAEIAKRLGISLSGAKSRVQRGRRQLEGVLRGSCQLEMDRRGNIIACKPVAAVACGQVSCDCDDAQSM
jgi:RNA polymerase sigma-70 factor (ECF subfamily)